MLKGGGEAFFVPLIFINSTSITTRKQMMLEGVHGMIYLKYKIWILTIFSSLKVFCSYFFLLIFSERIKSPVQCMLYKQKGDDVK